MEHVPNMTGVTVTSHGTSLLIVLHVLAHMVELKRPVNQALICTHIQSAVVVVPVTELLDFVYA